MVDNVKWHEIGERLSSLLTVCGCQRKLKTIVETLLEIHQKIKKKEPLNGAEIIVVAMLDRQEKLITHGTNIEYPILIGEDEWKWLREIRDNPNLEDN